MSYRALLLDVGGPLDDERKSEARRNQLIIEGFAAQGIDVKKRFSAANRRAITAFAPNLYEAVIFDLAGREATLARKVSQYFATATRGRPPLVLRPGMLDLVRDCHAAGLKIGICANQLASAREMLGQSPLGPYLSYTEVSATLGFRKPDPRLFLSVLEALDVFAPQAIMIGDRIDNDIAPANLLGLTTVRLQGGRHDSQQPRSLAEVPHAEAATVADLRRILIDFGIDIPLTAES